MTSGALAAEAFIPTINTITPTSRPPHQWCRRRPAAPSPRRLTILPVKDAGDEA